MSKIIKGSHFEKITGHGFLYLLGSFITKGLSVLMLPIYTKALLPEEYIVFSNLLAIAGLLGIVMSFYLDNAYARFYFDVDEQDTDNLRKLFSTLLFFLLGWGLFSGIIAIFVIHTTVVKVYNVPWFPYVLIIIAVPLVRRINLLAAVHFRSQHKSLIVTGINYLKCVVGIGVTLALLLIFHLKALSLLWGVLAGELVATVVYYTMLYRSNILSWHFSHAWLKKTLPYALGLLPLAAISGVTCYSDQLFVTGLSSKANSGIYAVAYVIGSQINVLVFSIFMVYGPMVIAMLKENSQKNKAQIEQFQSYYFHLLIGAAFFLSLFTPELFRFLVDEKYHAGAQLVPIIAFAFVFAGACRLYITPIYYHKLTLLVSLGGFLQMLVNVGINIIFIPRYGATAAAWSKFACMVVAALFFYNVCKKHEPIRFDWKGLGLSVSIIGLCLALFLFSAYILHLGFWALLVAKCLILCVAIICTWLSPFGRAINLLIEMILKKIRKTPQSETNDPYCQTRIDIDKQQ
jgi:O-antigen/teichoic acid export membrane protein